MAAPAPSSLFVRLASVWRHLSLRSDADDVVLELLGRFSLEKVYVGTADNESYHRLVITLLSQLNAIFYIQRLTIPAANVHVGRYLGFLVSWEVTLRSVEFILQVVVDGRESLYECRRLRDKYLAEFLLSALRILTLHPRAPANHRAKDRRDRFARIHKSLEQVFDSYPGTKSFLLLLSKEVTDQLHVDPDSLGLPEKLRYELPNLVSELYPLPHCLLPPYVSELVPQHDSPGSWLPAFLALRDVSHFVVGASIQYVVNQENRNVRLQGSSARSRNAILLALENLRMPSHLSKMDLVASFSATFRIVLPDTLDLSQSDSPELAIDELELDALDSLCARLSERQIIHRVSDRQMTHNIHQIISQILKEDSPTGQMSNGRPGLYVMNCPECHFVGGTELRASNISLPLDPDEDEISLPPESTCPECDENVTFVREVPLAGRTWELLQVLEPDADTINVERHMPSVFQLSAPKPDHGGYYNTGYSTTYSSTEPRTSEPTLQPLRRPTLRIPDNTEQSVTDLTRSPSQGLFSPLSPIPMQPPDTSGTDHFRSEGSTFVEHKDKDTVAELPLTHKDSTITAESRSLTTELLRRKSEPADKKGFSWRGKLPFTSKKAPAPPADSSSLSSSAIESQRVEEINLSGLFGSPRSSGRGRAAKNICTALSQSSSLALFWAQLAIHIWDLGTSPPSMVRSIKTESSCIQAAVGKTHMAYIIGTRDQKLTLRIVNVQQSSTPVVEYRMASSPWCKSIAIDKKENYVVVGFENSTVRFFKFSSTEQPREDKLHSAVHQDCSRCPPVDTLSFSQDGLCLLASTRSPRTGIIQLYLWRFPFLSFEELSNCRYAVPLHESEDNGISAALYRSGPEGDDGLICVSTWTQSGTPILAQPKGGHRSHVRTDMSGRHGRLGNRIQCAAFSPSGRELAMVNDKGHLYQISNLNSSPIDIKRLTNSKELTVKTGSYAMGYMTLGDEDSIVLAWAEPSKAMGMIKKLPATRDSAHTADGGGVVIVTACAGGQTDVNDLNSPVELAVNREPVELAATEPPSSAKAAGFTI